MIRYLVIHNKHEGCYDFQCYQDEVARIRLTSITINPPKIWMFNTRDEAQDFFEEYMNDVDCIDIRCKKGEDVEHIDYCTCGVIELDEQGEPILFYNKKNQIFLMENTPQMFLPNHDLKTDIKNLNLTNRLIRKCKSLTREQRKRYIELGKYCEDCNGGPSIDTSDDEDNKKDSNIILQENNPTPASTPAPTPAPKNTPISTPPSATTDSPSSAPPDTSANEKKKRAPRKPKTTATDKK